MDGELSTIVTQQIGIQKIRKLDHEEHMYMYLVCMHCAYSMVDCIVQMIKMTFRYTSVSCTRTLYSCKAIWLCSWLLHRSLLGVRTGQPVVLSYAQRVSITMTSS